MSTPARTYKLKPEDKVVSAMRRVAESVRRINGEDWYEGIIVCRAIGIDPKRAYRMLDPSVKRCIWVDKRRVSTMRRCLLVNRRGIEELVILRGALCRGRVMDALDAAMQGIGMAMI